MEKKTMWIGGIVLVVILLFIASASGVGFLSTVMGDLFGTDVKDSFGQGLFHIGDDCIIDQDAQDWLCVHHGGEFVKYGCSYDCSDIYCDKADWSDTIYPISPLCYESDFNTFVFCGDVGGFCVYPLTEEDREIFTELDGVCTTGNVCVKMKNS